MKFVELVLTFESMKSFCVRARNLMVCVCECCGVGWLVLYPDFCLDQ